MNEGDLRTNRGRSTRVIALLVILLAVLSGSPTAPAAADTAPGAPPTGLTVSQRATMAIVAWSAGVEGASYLLQWDAASAFAAPSQLVTEDTVSVVTGLRPETTYSVRVATWDPDAAAVGAWGPAVAFTTAEQPYPIAPPVLTASSATSTSITAGWTSVGEDLTYEVALGKDPSNLSTVSKTDERTTTFDDLKRTTKYYLSARALDSDGEPVTAWSDPVTSQTPDELPLTVASFNIKCNSCAKASEASWSTRKPAVVSTIRGQMPDVVGLQEASQGRMHGRSVSQFQDLVNGLGAPYAVTNRHDIGGGAGVDNRIVYNTSTLELVKHGAVKLPTASGANVSRYLAWAILRQKSTGKLFVFGDTHLEPGKQFNSLRERQTRAVISALKSVAATKDLPIVLVGDMNIHKWMSSGGYQPYSIFVGSGLLDPLGNTRRSHSASASAFVEKRIHTNYSTYNEYARSAPRFSYTNGTQLDFIFLTKMRVSEYEVVVNVDSSGHFVGRIPSDHNMIRATVWLP